MRSAEPLSDYDNCIGDWLDRWALAAPDRAFIIEQTEDGERTISYREARQSALTLAEGLLSFALGPERPLAILGGNSIDYALIKLAALYVGIPLAPIAPGYALQSIDYLKLAHTFRVLTPGMVIVEDGVLYRIALEHALKDNIPVLALRNPSANMATLASLRGNGSRRDAVKRRSGPRRPGNRREVPVYLGLNRHAQGGDQHSWHALCECSDEAPGCSRARR